LHSGLVRLSGAIAAQVVFYHLSYDNGLRIHIHPPVSSQNVASVLPVSSLNLPCASTRRSGSFGTAILSTLLTTHYKNENHDPESDLSGRDQRVRAGVRSDAGANAGADDLAGDAARHFPASDHGTSLDTLMAILARLGIATTPVLFEHHELSELPLPAILHYGAKSLCPAGLAQRQPRVRNEPGDWRAVAALCRA
jgi:hypothetical protein